MSEGSAHALDRLAHGDLVLHADLHMPTGTPQGTLLIAHGFLGYKDYGMMPRLAEAAASAGWAGIRFNFAHSGMSRNVERFEYLDRFQHTTWNRQIEDLSNLVEGVRDGSLHESLPSGGPIVVLGHSRGGTTCILAAGRGLDVQGVVSIAAPASSIHLSAEELTTVRMKGYLDVRSNRTKQDLRINCAYLNEIDEDSIGHDVEAMASKIRCPLLLIHGTADETVAVGCAARIAEAATNAAAVETLILNDGNHVLNVANPLSRGDSSDQLDSAILSLTDFLASVAG